jgi:hypothetical protein
MKKIFLKILVIIYYLLLISCNYENPTLTKARRNKINRDLQKIIYYSDEFKFKFGRFPKNLDELLNSDIAKNGDINKLDLWNREYYYSISGNVIQVFTLGKDGIQGGDGENEDIILKSN